MRQKALLHYHLYVSICSLSLSLQVYVNSDYFVVLLFLDLTAGINNTTTTTTI